MERRNKAVRRLVLAAMFLALGLALPFLTGQIPQIGGMLLPMHLPVFLCGLICGWQYGAVVGLVTPVLRSFLFSMPPMFPTAAAMAFELMTYGLVAGALYGRARWKCVVAVYKALAAAMVCGRIVWGGVTALFMGVSGNHFTFAAFVSGALVTAIPGILLQLILIPTLMVALGKAGMVEFHGHGIHMKVKK